MISLKNERTRHWTCCGEGVYRVRMDAGGQWVAGDVVFRKEWYRKTGKEVIEGRPLLHRLLGSILKDVEFV